MRRRKMNCEAHIRAKHKSHKSCQNFDVTQFILRIIRKSLIHCDDTRHFMCKKGCCLFVLYCVFVCLFVCFWFFGGKRCRMNTDSRKGKVPGSTRRNYLFQRKPFITVGSLQSGPKFPRTQCLTTGSAEWGRVRGWAWDPNATMTLSSLFCCAHKLH